MKLRPAVFLLNTLMSLLSPLFADGSRSAPVDLTVIMGGFRNDKGIVIVDLFDVRGDRSFPKEESSLQRATASIAKGRASLVFVGLPVGNYAIAAIHDEDENGHMNLNFLGIPIEGYAFSNNPKLRIGPPNFKDASFKVDESSRNCLLHIKPNFDTNFFQVLMSA